MTSPMQALASDPVSGAIDLSGAWVFHEAIDGGLYVRAELHQQDHVLSGSCGAETLRGAWRGHGKGRGGVIEVELQAHCASGRARQRYRGFWCGDRLEGEVTSGGVKALFTAWPRRPPARAPIAQTCVPDRFHHTYSETHAPALRILPGDTVTTSTPDASGHDAAGARRTHGGNPVIGPFHVEGAWPGDTLAVRILSVTPSRTAIQSGSRVSSRALDPHLFARLERLARTRRKEARSRDAQSTPSFNRWTLDLASNYASLTRPTPALASWRIPIAPMLGCVAVAPPRHQSIETHDLGAFGGNLDYARARAGVTLYLPVFVPGARLFLGDGHAAQGAGEVTGDALESPMTVTFTTHVLPSVATPAPRWEDATDIMASGIGGSLDDALRHATSSLVHWLMTDWSLTGSEAQLVAGFGVVYDIAAIVNPRLHVVARLPRAGLPPDANRRARAEAHDLLR